MHVLILNQTFHPDVASTGQLMWELAQRLARHGHRISVITSRYFYGTDRRHDLPFERLGAIEIHRVGGTPLGKGSLLGRIGDFASFYLAAAGRLWEVDRPDVILALTSPPMVSTLALLAHQFRGIPYVYHVMDLYPDAAIASGMISDHGLPAHLMRRLTAATVSSAAAVIALGRDMRQRILAQYTQASAGSPRGTGHQPVGSSPSPGTPGEGRGEGNPQSAIPNPQSTQSKITPRLSSSKSNPKPKIHVLSPWADGTLLHPLPKHDNPLARALGLTDTFNIVYSGNLGIAHDLDTIIAAIDLMRDDPAGLCWLFIGGGQRFQQLQRQARDRGWSNVRFLPFQDKPQLNQSLNLADVHLVSQLPAFTGVVVPSKLFGVLAVGRPAVMIGPAEAECSRILNDHQNGFVVPNGDAYGLVKCLRELRESPALRDAMGRRAREAFEIHYQRTCLCDRIEAILRHAAACAR